MENDEVKQGKLENPKMLALHYMRTLVDVARESFLILDDKLRVISANPTFYKVFLVSPQQTENKFLYELGNGQWNSPELKSLLEEVLPKRKIVRNFEVSHVFENIGAKTMVLNGKQVDSIQLIILAIEDITDRKKIENDLAEHTRNLEMRIAERTKELANQIKELEMLNGTMEGRELRMVELKKENEALKERVKNNNNRNSNHKGDQKK